MKKKLTACLAFILAMSMMLALVGCGSTTENKEATASTPSSDAPATETPERIPEKDAIRLKFNHTVVETSLWHEYALKYAELINERTNGKYIIDVFPSDQLAGGNQVKSVEMLRAGSIDLDIHALPIWAGIDERFTIVNMPWLFPTFDDVDAFLNGEGSQAVLDLLWDNGVVPVGMAENGYRQVYNRLTSINSPEDMKNLKIRVPATPMFVDLYSVLGCDSTQINWGEVFSALQQKTVDGMEGTTENIYAGQFQEVNSYMTIWNACYDVLIMSMSQKLYDSLTPEEQEIFLSTGKEVMAELSAAVREENEFCQTEMEKVMETNYLTEEQMADFREAVQPVYDKYSDVFPQDLKDILNY